MIKLAKQLLRKIVLREKFSSETYIKFLQKKGISIGNGTKIFDPQSTRIDLTYPGLLEIGERVNITSGVKILTHSFDWDVFREVYGDIINSAGRVKIGNNVFIGMNAIILKGVDIGDNVIIGAGAIVSRSIPSNSIAIGQPARVVMTLREYYNKRCKQAVQEAKQYAIDLKAKTGKWPTKLEMNGYHRLFMSRTPENLEYEQKHGYHNLYLSGIQPTADKKKKIEELFADKFYETTPEWESYDEFIGSLNAVCDHNNQS
jgi:acetyltransferase-like isoleucine patch superfamily enzyme